MSDLIKRLRFASPCPDSLMVQAADALEQIQKDRVRMDYLESEPTDNPGTLFRRNMQITRASIDAAIEVVEVIDE